MTASGLFVLSLLPMLALAQIATFKVTETAGQRRFSFPVRATFVSAQSGTPVARKRQAHSSAVHPARWRQYGYRFQCQPGPLGVARLFRANRSEDPARPRYIDPTGGWRIRDPQQQHGIRHSGQSAGPAQSGEDRQALLSPLGIAGLDSQFQKTTPNIAPAASTMGRRCDRRRLHRQARPAGLRGAPGEHGRIAAATARSIA